MAIHVVFLVVFCSGVSCMDLTAVQYRLETDGRVSVKLDWDVVDSATYYRVFQRKGGNDWQSISTFDDASPNRVIRVLNAFPAECSSYAYDAVLSAKFVYSDGTSVELPKSSALKVWMEGGKIDGVVFPAYGINETTGDPFIEVDVIPYHDINSNPSVIWNYDVVAFGTWDASAVDDPYFPTCNVQNTDLVDELTEYLNRGYSVIASHDVICAGLGTTIGLGRIRSYFGIKVGGRETRTDVDSDANGVLMQNVWDLRGNQIEVIKNGHIVSYPWSIPGKYLSTYIVHTYGNMATSDVWMRIVVDETYKVYKPFQYALNEGEDVAYYLTTNNNTAMIQSGHDQCNATEPERKIWANLIVSLKQRTASTSTIDHSCIDQESPLPPICNCFVSNGQYSLRCYADDSETIYQYRVQAYNDTGSVVAESTASVNAASGIDYMVYHVSAESSMRQDELLAKTTKINPGENVEIGSYSGDMYLHVLAVDKSGNPSEIASQKVSKCQTIMTPLYNSPRVHDGMTRAGIFGIGVFLLINII